MTNICHVVSFVVGFNQFMPTWISQCNNDNMYFKVAHRFSKRQLTAIQTKRKNVPTKSNKLIEHRWLPVHGSTHDASMQHNINVYFSCSSDYNWHMCEIMVAPIVFPLFSCSFLLSLSLSSRCRLVRQEFNMLKSIHVHSIWLRDNER